MLTGYGKAWKSGTFHHDLSLRLTYLKEEIFLSVGVVAPLLQYLFINLMIMIMLLSEVPSIQVLLDKNAQPPEFFLEPDGLVEGCSKEKLCGHADAEEQSVATFL
ncbi:hypothetical protein HAX54_010073 [Datura stramonium]|uniref:Uncharacterized protein n=1 Tax=Datura stramonium TaxID=4076 RepID=A0ABS8WY78_DATST|nr:hypothetical protein [Datura stramonium]